MTSTRALLLIATLLVAALCAAYVPYAGRGFKQDDFGWVASSRVREPGDWVALFGRNTGFYRPAVGVTFALDELAFGMRPLGYGLTNVALLIGCLFAVAALGRAVGLSRGGALAAGACWSLNTQGINMAVVWTSGRTALVLVLFAALAARALLRGRSAQATFFTFLALLSKEEAVMLPVIMAVWAGLSAHGEGTGRRFDAVAAFKRTWPLAIALVGYGVLRYHSGAFGPLSAPPYYRPTFAAAKIAENVIRYVDFAATFPVAVVVLAAIVAWRIPRPPFPRVRVVVMGIVWVIGGYAITTFVPVRSPLYACFPAVGTALAAAALLEAVWNAAGEPARWRLAVAGVVLPFLLLPAYWARNVRHARGAELSAQLLHDLDHARAQIPPGAVVVLRDDPALPPTERLPAAFATLFDIAVRDTLGRPTRSWMEPPPDGWQLSGLQPPDPASPKVVFALRAGHLVRVAGGEQE